MPKFASILIFLGLSIFSTLTLTFNANAQVDPNLEWKTISTEHFEVIFNANHQALGERVAVEAERAHARLFPVFGQAPAKTVVVVRDDTDMTNGFATPIPRPMINIFPVLPHSMDSLSHYGNWIEELLVHEYTHVLNFEPTSGVMTPLRFVFGSIIHPNGLLPRWYMEGLAVEMETRFTPFGRLRSPLTQASIRAMVEEDTLRGEDISRINESKIPSWPHGQRPYFLGSLLWREMIAQQGVKVVRELNEDYSGRIPFFLNGPAENRLKKTYSRLLNDTYDEITQTADKQARKIEQQRVTKGEPLPPGPHVVTQLHPLVSPDGMKLLVVQNSLLKDQEIILYERSDKNVPFTKIAGKVLDGRQTILRTTWAPDSQGFYFDALDTFDRYYEFFDIHYFDLRTHKARALTKGLRAQEPTASPNGTSIAFVMTSAGTTKLALTDTEGQNLKILYESPFQHRIARPEFVSATQIVFAERTENGRETFQVFDLLTAKKTELFDSLTYVGFPVMTPNGLLFTSLHTGVANLYLASQDLKFFSALTNTTTHIYDGTIDPHTGTLYYARLTAKGARVEAVPVAPRKASPPIVEYKESWPQTSPAESPTQTKFEVDDYSAFGFMWPQYWIPFLTPIADGMLFQALINGNDPLGLHAYSAQLGFDTLTNKPSLGVEYLNNQTRVAWSVAASDTYSYFYATKSSTHSTSASLAAGFYVPGLSDKYKAGISASYISTDYWPGNPIATRAGPGVFFRYSDFSQKEIQISPEKGNAYSLSYSYFPSEWGNLSYGLLNASGVQYWSDWLPERHALMLKLDSAWSPANRSLLLGSTTAGGEYMASLLSSSYVVRGYPPGNFLGWSLATTTLEYRFPLQYAYSGFDTKPLFMRKWSGAFVIDSVTLDGRYYDSETARLERTNLGTFYAGAGLEARADVTLAYHLSAAFRFGLHHGFTKKAYGGLTPYFGLSIAGL